MPLFRNLDRFAGPRCDIVLVANGNANQRYSVRKRSHRGAVPGMSDHGRGAKKHLAVRDELCEERVQKGSMAVNLYFQSLRASAWAFRHSHHDPGDHDRSGSRRAVIRSQQEDYRSVTGS